MSDATGAQSPQTSVKPPRFAYAFAKEQGLILLDADSSECVVGVRDDGTRPDPFVLVEARRAAGKPVRFEALEQKVFERRLSEIYSVEGLSAATFEEDDGVEDLSVLAEGLPETADLLDTEDDAPVIRLINALIAEAVKTRASDIHVEPYETSLAIRLRIDGVLREVLSLPPKMTPVLTSRVKVMARLDIAEKRVPQDGRISLAMGGKLVDVRVSTLPSRFGERIVMRLLDKEQAQLDLDVLGMPQAIRQDFEKVLRKPNGVILVTGPTGSGKTTTLYAALTLLNEPGINILTVEDPVEYALEGVGQTQVNSKVGMTFATGLRAILRQDPDVVMVGEVRDVETAQIAVQASLTGHLVMSTVHTNSAIGAVTRLRDMGVEPFLLSPTIAGVLAQRLVRRLCEKCKEPAAPNAAERELLGIKENKSATIYHPKGCPACNGTGYEGRVGLYELVTVTDELRKLIYNDAGEQALKAEAFKDAPTLGESGFQHVLEGRTSIEEVLRVVQESEG